MVIAYHSDDSLLHCVDMTDFLELGYVALFLSAFLAATLLPLSSEAVLSALLLSDYQASALLLVATLGNVLGACVNYYLGYKVSHISSYEDWREQNIQKGRALRLVENYGAVSLLLSWVPIIGDPITFINGVIRTRLWVFLALVTLSKCLRYVVIIFITHAVT